MLNAFLFFSKNICYTISFEIELWQLLLVLFCTYTQGHREKGHNHLMDMGPPLS